MNACRMTAAWLLLAVPVLSGCGSSGDAAQAERQPRPVEVRTLKSQAPPQASLVTASVASWKTEEIGFEVGGRVEWVVEPNEEIEGRVESASSELILEGTPIARLESERYQLQLDTAKANVAQATQSVRAAKIELEKSLPAQIRAAQAEETLARTVLDRTQKVFSKGAGTQSDVDRELANHQTAKARLEQLDASLKAKEAEVQSLESRLLQAQQAQRDAERDLEDCTLYSSFRGQIADVSVVPGSVVTAGQPVATIQMMDPIKVELEVSATDSRRLRNRQRLPVMVSQPDGGQKQQDAYLYLIDSVADPAMRTYTVTLLLLNEKISNAKLADDPSVATTTQTWRMDFKFLPGAKDGTLFVSEDAILADDEGSYLWKVENTHIHEPLPKDNLLKVSKLRVKRGPAKLPFLGNWVFQQVLIDDESFDPEVNLVAGKLSVKEGEPGDWNGDTVLINSGSQWAMRPGDLVQVDLSGTDLAEGFFVPMDAIVSAGGKTYLMVVEPSEGDSAVSRREVSVVTHENAATSSMRRVEPLEGSTLDGVTYVSRGAHYLHDGEAVKVVAGKAAAP